MYIIYKIVAVVFKLHNTVRHMYDQIWNIDELKFLKSMTLSSIHITRLKSVFKICDTVKHMYDQIWNIFMTFTSVGLARLTPIIVLLHYN